MSTSYTNGAYHDDIIKWKHLLRYCPFVRWIHRSLVNSPYKGQWHGALMFSLICALNKRLSKQSWSWWFEMPYRYICIATRATSQYRYDKYGFPCVGISAVKLRRSWDRLIFIMGIPILVNQRCYIETTPWCWIMGKFHLHLAAVVILLTCKASVQLHISD